MACMLLIAAIESLVVQKERSTYKKLYDTQISKRALGSIWEYEWI